VNISDETQVKSARIKEKLGRDREIADMKYLLSSMQGKRVLWRYLEECGVFRSSMTGNSQTFFLEGRRDIGLRILSDIMEANPDAYLEMSKLAKEGKI
jgi:hypothetical protein